MASDYTSNQFVSTNTCAASAASSSRWLTEEVFKLIDIVQRDEAIYNPRHKYYFCRPYVENFWREVDLKLEKNPGASLAKWTNLRISFRREYTNYLEEKVPPCWSYFDRMFFLHPYLRKKHQQPKSLDTQVQDALAHLSSLSSRMQRERTVNNCPAGSSTNGNNNPGQVNTSSAVQSPQQQQLDNYLDYFDEHDHNNSELDEIIDEEHRARFQNDIKSECEEPVDDYEPETEAEPEQRVNQHHQHHDEDEHDEHEMRALTYDTAAPSSTSNSASLLPADKRYAQHYQQHANSASSSRLQHVNRLQLRSYQDEVRAQRSRSQELQGAAAAAAATAAAVSAANMQTHPNISFVRPTFTSKPVDMVSTTTHASASVAGIGVASTSDAELPAPSTGAASAPTTSSAYLSQRHIHMPHSHSHAHHQTTATQRLEVNNSSGTVATAGAVELCDCKTDSDAMFLMSLLPDIQKLNGRDRGKIKIAFQNILQDYLYPD
ncbi:uncharacterized protein LOC6562993 [Drosophila grimshawi]|uniref:GH18744 n=1 Tax=Drosophila grimshawi TaxID=7222 RepID=B4JGD7_DROGR|nr:uncharacterized protein LOC6562993 [Drosophila grimshawi]EDV92606.1 GH18744 [Drosophila grimshawi]